MSWLGRLTGRRTGESLPGWAALDLPWREAEFCVVDLETTGLDLRRDQIVSYGSVLVREGRIVAATTNYGLVRPTVEVSASALKVHALTAAELAGAPALEACADSLAEQLRDRVLVAHAAWVERAFIKRAFALRDLRLDGPVVDTAALTREVRLAPSGSDDAEPGLERLAGRLNLPVHTPHHALGDALTTAGVLLALLARIEEHRTTPLTVRELTQISARHTRRT